MKDMVEVYSIDRLLKISGFHYFDGTEARFVIGKDCIVPISPDPTSKWAAPEEKEKE